MQIPADIKYILTHALEQADHAFNEASEDFDDYTDDDIKAHEEGQAAAKAWLDSLEEVKA